MFDFISFAETHNPLITVIVLLTLALAVCIGVMFRSQLNKIRTKLDEFENKLTHIHDAIDRISQVEAILTENIKDPRPDNGIIYNRHLLKAIREVKTIVCSENCPALKVVDSSLGSALYEIKELMRRNLERITQIEKDTDVVHSRIDNWTEKILEVVQRVSEWRGPRG